jgi:NAD(P)-dependent dehydrogenase (short-subunit alcohol dehydrogenase family)
MPDVVAAGGTGGLGSVAVRLLARDWRIVASYRSDEERASRIQDVATLVRCDLAIEEDRARLLDTAQDLYGLVVFSGDPARVAEPSRLGDAMIRSHEGNYLGPILLAREAAERMRAAGTHGAIVLISTMQAVSVFPGSTAYAGQKAALIQAAKILAKECRGRTDIRVNVVCPGVNQAGMAEASIASGKYDRYITDDFIPRFGRADDVARAVRFLLEPDSYITGQVLTIDGGLTL